MEKKWSASPKTILAIDSKRSGGELAKHLARHGVDVTLNNQQTRRAACIDIF
jgi:hypothetical protein